MFGIKRLQKEHDYERKELYRRIRTLERQMERMATHLGLYWKTVDEEVPRWEGVSVL